MGNGKGKAFRGHSKNRNKALDKEERRLKHIKKVSAKQFNTTETTRANIKELKKDRVEVNGRLVVFKKNDPFAPCLLQNLFIGKKFVDHVWIIFPISERRKLKFAELGSRIHFTARVTQYQKRRDRDVQIKYGLNDVQLIKE